MQTRTKKNAEILPSRATHCIYSVTVLKNSLGAMDYSWRGGGRWWEHRTDHTRKHLGSRTAVRFQAQCVS